jgi:hypothetical protein
MISMVVVRANITTLSVDAVVTHQSEIYATDG